MKTKPPPASSEGTRPSPRAFMRERRPERFSDSVLENETTLDRSMLEYHLSTITSRSQEVQFENLARKLLEREVCPNLLPHTGPTGGGDSKVDSETFPVAEELALGWYVGTTTAAASERWAFAFSAKEDWRTKVKQDIEKIAKTARGYTKAFFVSSQFVRDKDRAELEDELRTRHKLDVRIFDRSWLLDRVFAGQHWTLAIDELNLSPSLRPVLRKGPNDTAREKELEELEARIQAALREVQHTPQLASDCHDAAVLARNLERPRTEVEGQFTRAERMARKVGTQHQQLLATYERAWTTFWWFEDYDAFLPLYETVEQLAKDTTNVYQLELLSNLWQLLRVAAKDGDVTKITGSLAAHTATLRAELERLATDATRPSTALQAKTLHLLTQIDPSNLASTETVFRELKDVVQRSEGMVGYPLKPIIQIVSEMGSALSEVPAYDDLVETIVAVSTARDGDISGASLLLERGLQQLENNKPYQAIKTLGRALRRLYKHESRHKVIKALYLCSLAYERAGLLWAARGSVLTAASIAANEFWKYEQVTPLQALCYNRMKWLELRLGRVPHTLAWHELDGTVQRILIEQGYEPNRLLREETTYAVLVGLLFLKADFMSLRTYEKLPRMLDDMGLPMASLALLYALGHEDAVAAEFAKADEKIEPLVDFFLTWLDQPAEDKLPAGPLPTERRKVTLHSSLMGCKITVEADNKSPCIELAESVLAALEALLATAFLERVMAMEPALTIEIRRSELADEPFSFELKDVGGQPRLAIRTTAFDAHQMGMEEQSRVKDLLSDILIKLFARLFMFEDVKTTVTKLMRDERASERAVNFTSSFVTLANAIGDVAKFTLEAWESEECIYPLKRSAAWNAAVPEREKLSSPLRPGSGEPPAELLDGERFRHDQMSTVSLIRQPLWRKAAWLGTFFLFSPDASAPPPFLGLIFRDARAADEIFSVWRKELGTGDEHDRLRVSIIRGVTSRNPNHYRVVIGANPQLDSAGKGGGHIVVINQVSTMTPTSGENLAGFVEHYQRARECFLVPAIMPDRDPTQEPDVHFKLALRKKTINLRNAWEIGRHDLDLAGLLEDDDPIIPPTEKNPPVRDLLEWKRTRK